MKSLLLCLHRGDDVKILLKSTSHWGGFSQTWLALERRGLVFFDGKGEALTEKGRQIAVELAEGA